MNIIDSYRQHRKSYLVWAGLGLILITIIATWLKFKAPIKSFGQGPAIYTHYNNYLIFKSSHHHLLAGNDLYGLYPEEHHDLYKYSPAFALAFGLLAQLPDAAGLMLWNLLNVLLFFFALSRKSAPWSEKFPLLFIFLLPELITSTQNSQSNALMTGLLLFAYFDLEEHKANRAAVWIVLAAFIKIYAGLGALMFIFYPKKIRFIVSGFIATIVLLGLPLVLTSPDQLWMQYQSWWQMLTHDHEGSYGVSLMYLINLMFPAFHNKSLLQLLGVLSLILLCFPLSKYKLAINRVNYLAMILLALIIFNHKTESATFIVAVTGIAIWFFSKIKPTGIEILVLLLALLFTVLSATDVFPTVIRKSWVIPYAVKVWPCILIYMMIGYELVKGGREEGGTEKRRVNMG